MDCGLLYLFRENVHFPIYENGESILGLRYDKRDAGSKGLRLLHDVHWDGRMQLQADDRLEPSLHFPDVGKIFDVKSFPVLVTFWRPSRETMSRHRNPLFGIHGVTPERALTVDIMHSIHLGVMLAFCKTLIWRMLLAGTWGLGATQEETAEIGSQILRSDLDAWYKNRHRQFPDERLTRVMLTAKKLGKPSDPQLKTKAAQTYGVLLYLADKLRLNMHRLGGDADRFLGAANALVELLDIFKSCGTRMPISRIQAAFSAYHRFLSLTADDLEMLQPKRHLILHMLRKIKLQGNPKALANWQVETLNRLLKQTCRTTSQKTFESSVLLRMHVLLRGGQTRGQKRK